jgi:hypothetical protein
MREGQQRCSKIVQDVKILKESEIVNEANIKKLEREVAAAESLKNGYTNFIVKIMNA